MVQLESDNLPFLATTLAGLEEVLGNELLGLGARDIKIATRAVSFAGDKGFLYKANLNLHTAIRILVPFQQFKARNSDQLYEQVLKLPWEDLIDVRKTLAVNAAIHSPFFNHTLFVSQKVKDGIIDRIREKKGARPSVDLEAPDFPIHIHIREDQCTLSLDSSGESLHKRGYRSATNIAPMNEVLAAGLVALSGWDQRSAFIDPMCGSGTIAIEAALFAARIPPGYFRMSGISKQIQPFAFMGWDNFDAELWEKIYQSSVNKIRESDIDIFASDVSPNVLKKAKENIRNSRTGDMIHVSGSDFRDLRPPEGARPGVIVINPPYGERMDKDDLNLLYKEMGDALKKNWTGYTCWIISPDKEAVQHLGLHASRKITLFNGSLECKYMKFEMYTGSKKQGAS
ncbi:MAG: class I SAM-dependent RNA methyltransferase [Bacteroidia bacterium]|nr:class I SAM-dependent RNA methyltransferase [Bacteroidia bacterium]